MTVGGGNWASLPQEDELWELSSFKRSGIPYWLAPETTLLHSRDVQYSNKPWIPSPNVFLALGKIPSPAVARFQTLLHKPHTSTTFLNWHLTWPQAALLKATTEGLVQESPPQAPADSNETDYIEDSPEPEKSPRSKARSKATPKAKPRGKPSTAAPTPNTAQARGRQLQSNDGAVGEGGVSPRPPKAAEVGKRGRTEEGPAGWGKRGGVAVAQSLKQEREVTEELVDRKPAFKKVKTGGQDFSVTAVI